MLTTGEPGPVHQSKWRNGKDIQGIRLLGLSFRQRARWFTKCWKEILRHAGIQVEFAYGKPFSQVMQMYTGCAALPWPLERLSIADEWMLSKCHTTFRRQARIIDSLPFADADDRFQPFLVTTTVASAPKTGSSRDYCWPQKKMGKWWFGTYIFYFSIYIYMG